MRRQFLPMRSEVGEQRRDSPAQPMPVEVPEGEPIRCGALRRVLFTVSALVISYMAGLFRRA